MAKQKLVVIGNGMAGARAVEDVLARGGADMFDIVMFGDEPYGNYNRILLSNILNGTQTADEILINPLDWYAENGITLHTGHVVDTIDRAARVVISRGRRPRDLRSAADCDRQPRLHSADEGRAPGRRTIEAGRLRLSHPRRLQRHRRLRQDEPGCGDDRRRPPRPRGGAQHDGARLRVACRPSRRPSDGDAARPDGGWHPQERRSKT